MLIITQYFPPEMGAPQARLYELATRLKNKGCKITILTAMPNYPTGRIFENYRGKICSAEDMEAMKVIRVWLYSSKSSRTLPRLLSYLSFAVSLLLFGIWKLGRQDVVLVESPPLFIMPAALIVGKITRGKTVMMVSDIWPDIIVRMGHTTGGLGIKLMLWLEKFSYNHCHAVALTNPGACRQIRQRFPQLKNVTVISNGVDTKLFKPDLRSEKIRAELGAGKNDFLVGYCGLHGLAQGLDVVLNAADILRERKNIKFVMIGDGPTKEQLVRKAVQLNLPNITFFPHRSKKEMPEILASLDASLIPLVVRLPGTMPSKVYEALAAAVPPIVAKGCEAESLLTQFGAGCSYEPGDGKDMAAAILGLANDPRLWSEMRENCSRLAARFDRDIIAQRTEIILTSIAEEKPLPPIDW